MNNKQKQQLLHEIFNDHRGLLLDFIKQQVTDVDKWPHVRSRILKILSSERGLEAKVTEFLQRAKSVNCKVGKSC